MLCPCNGFATCSISFCSAIFDLDEMQFSASFGDDINLAQFIAIVLLDNLESLYAQISHGLGLANVTCCSVVEIVACLHIIVYNQTMSKKIQLFGDYHVHSEFSRDGHATVDQIVKEAVKIGLKEVAITDHGVNATRAGMRQKNFPLVTALVAKANKEHPIKVLQGIEANVIGRNGEIDVSEEVRTNLDILLAGFHGLVKMKTWKDVFAFKIPNYFWMILRLWPKGRIRKNTEIMKKVIEQNDVDIWVHPNLYFKLDVVEVARTCAERGTVIELNRRISFRPIDWERMKATGAKFIISSDFHSFDRHKLGEVAETQQEFLDLVDWEPSDFVNMVGEFQRGGAGLLSKVKESQYDDDQTEEVIEKPRKMTREEKKREKVIRRKKV